MTFFALPAKCGVAAAAGWSAPGPGRVRSSGLPGPGRRGRRRRDVSGAAGSAIRPAGRAGAALDCGFRGRPQRHAHERGARRGNYGGLSRAGERHPQTRRSSQDGAGEQGVRTFPLVDTIFDAPRRCCNIGAFLFFKPKMRTVLQKQRKPSIRPTANTRWSARATSASPRTLTRAKRPRPSAFSFTPASSTRSATWTTATP